MGTVLWHLAGKQSPLATQEIPFQNVIKENEQRLAASQHLAAKPEVLTGTPDSLTLRAVTTDSVWIQLVIDHLEPREYLFKPNARISWKAKERFSLTLGNAGGIQLTLNQKQLGVLGSKGSVVRNKELTRQLLTVK